MPSRARGDERRPATGRLGRPQARRRGRAQPDEAPAARGVLGGADGAPDGPRLRDRGAPRCGRARPRARRAAIEEALREVLAEAGARPETEAADERACGRSPTAPVRLYQRRSRPRFPRAASTIRPARSTRCRRSGASAYCGASCWPPGGCCAATPGATAASTSSRTRRSSAHRPTAAPAMIFANILQPLIDVCQCDPGVLARQIGDVDSWGFAIILLTVTVRLADPAADLQGREVDAAAPGAPARDQEDPGALQGRQAAHEPGDDGLLPGAQGQSAGLVPAAAAAAPVLHRALLPAALPTSSRGDRRQPGASSSSTTWPRRSPTGAARRPDRALRRDAARRERGHGDQRGPDAAAHHVRAAVRLRALHHQLRGRPDRLLDHDERLDDRAAAARAKALSRSRRRRSATGHRRRDGRRQPPPAQGKPRPRRQAKRPRRRGRRRQAPGGGNGGSAKAPPRSPRKKKKRSGRGGERRCPRAGSTVAEAEGETPRRGQVGGHEGARARFPGITADCVELRGARGGGDGRPARVRAEVDEDAWSNAAETMPEEPAERVRAIVGAGGARARAATRPSTSRRARTRSARP